MNDNKYITLFNKVLSTTGKNNIFFLDGKGALASFFGIFICFIVLQPWFGLPKYAAIYLLCLPGLYSMISFALFIFKPVKWQIFLKVVALLNLIYCFITLWIMITFRGDLTFLGYLYFIIEKLIILPLVFFEWKLSNQPLK